MAGHSHWHNIMHKKKIKDMKKSQNNVKIIREIMSAARQGGSDPNDNPRLSLAISKAKASSELCLPF